VGALNLKERPKIGELPLPLREVDYPALGLNKLVSTHVSVF
jgi:hypothetical protein